MNINLIVKKFFNENDYYKLAEKIIIVRDDGINIYANFDNSFESSSIGALVGGVWQAAESISSILKPKNDFFDFRMAFDTSSDGLYILPLKILQRTFYICVIYCDLDNPAKLKRSVRLLKENLEVYLSQLSFNMEENRKGYLFDNITDDEMDHLFFNGRA